MILYAGRCPAPRHHLYSKVVDPENFLQRDLLKIWGVAPYFVIVMKNLGIYIHIPFCRAKCRYCDFCSHAPRDGEREAYVAALKSQIESYKPRFEGYVAGTVYFGGGTPTLLPPRQLGDILDVLGKNIEIDAEAEITTECNPATVDKSALEQLRSYGINRLSIGVQSLNDNELRSLGRLHTAEQFVRTFEDAREAGFDNISLDLMYGIPEQTSESWHATLDAAVALKPQHISAYGLRVEQGTPFGDMGDKLILPDENATVQMYLDAVERLEAAGIYQYEISNFACQGRESRHNIKYWRCEPYVGFGAAAHSCFEGYRYAAPGDVSAFVDGQWTEEASRISLNETDMESEYVMLVMRLKNGLCRADYISKFGIDPDQKYSSRLQKYVREGYAQIDEKGYRFTLRGMLVSNYILADILDI